MDNIGLLLLLLGASGVLYRTPSVQRSKSMYAHNWGLNLTTPQLIASMGYPVEVHYVITADGYILEMHRIPYGIAGPSRNRRVAYLEHCILCSSSDYIMNVLEKALAYKLADAGYDVWLSNMRGNTYSKRHVKLNPKDIEFWNFSWDEMAFYDVPASIDYVLAVTGADGVYYTGWSMGTTVFWAMMSERPEYNLKVKAMAAMAPVAYMHNAKGPIYVLAPISDFLDHLLTLFGIGELLPSTETFQWFVEWFCDIRSATAEVCNNFLFLIGGPNPDEIPKEFLPLILSHTPAGTSVHTYNHYSQVVMSGLFRKYDYGRRGNIRRYGQRSPPLFKVENVMTPVALFWSDNDWIAAPKDVALLARRLPNLVLNHRVNNKQFNHLDFGWGIHADEYVYRYILDFFENY